jgi:metal-responsive CopG/Arc/MetJ family transcriptional regulator
MPDHLLRELDAAASKKGESRASVIREAVATYVASNKDAEADRRYAEAYRRIPEDRDLLTAMEATSAESLKDDPW